MDIIETGDPDAFKKYLSEYDNTICGRHPISVFLHVSSSYIFSSHQIDLTLRSERTLGMLFAETITSTFLNTIPFSWIRTTILHLQTSENSFGVL